MTMTSSDLLQLVSELESRKQAIPLGDSASGRQFARAEECVSVVGPPRCGKTSSVFIPAVAIHPGPVIATSIRPDLRDETVVARARVAAAVSGTVYELVLDEAYPPAPQAQVVRWDLAEGCESWNVAQDRAASLIGASMTGRDDGHWRGTGQRLLAASLFAGRRNDLTDREIAGKLDLRDTEDLQDYLAREAATDEQSLSASYAMESVLGDGAAAPDELGSIFSTLTSRSLAGVRYTPPGNAVEFDVQRFLRSCGTLYITVREQRARYLAPWIAAFVEMLVTTWREIPRSEKPRSLLLALDEVANVAPADSIPSLVTSGGGDGIQLLLGFQEPGQARRWQEQSSVVLNGTSHTIIFPGLADEGYLGSLARLLGKSVQYDPHITISSELPASPRFASPQRLIEERTRLEAAISTLAGGWRHRFAHIAAIHESTRLLVERLRLGIQSRMAELKGADAVLQELLTYTRVDMKSDRREHIESADIFAGRGDRSVLVRSGPTAEFRDAPRYYEDPRWRAILSA